jgi:exportin-1
MLSEEIFDHSKNQMTQQQIKELKEQMNKDFTTIFELCKLIMQNLHQVKQSLIRACLETLNAFLSWIPMYYIIYTDLIDKLVLMFPSDYLRNHALACLVEIASLPIDNNSED